MRKGFTLIEILMVMGILAMLAALLFPTFASVRGSAKSTRCIGNLRQVGLGMDLYTGDFDGIYPRAVNSTPPVLMGWIPSDEDSTEVYRTLRNVPSLKEAMRPYLASDEIWHCPSDLFAQRQLVRHPDGVARYFDFSPTSFASIGTSYAYRMGLGFEGVQSPAACIFHGPPDTDYGPSQSIVVWDLNFNNHRLRSLDEGVYDPDAMRQNALFADGHTKAVNGTTFTRGTLCNGK